VEEVFNIAEGKKKQKGPADTAKLDRKELKEIGNGIEWGLGKRIWTHRNKICLKKG